MLGKGRLELRGAPLCTGVVVTGHYYLKGLGAPDTAARSIHGHVMVSRKACASPRWKLRQGTVRQRGQRAGAMRDIMGVVCLFPRRLFLFSSTTQGHVDSPFSELWPLCGHQQPSGFATEHMTFSPPGAPLRAALCSPVPPVLGPEQPRASPCVVCRLAAFYLSEKVISALSLSLHGAICQLLANWAFCPPRRLCILMALHQCLQPTVSHRATTLAPWRVCLDSCKPSNSPHASDAHSAGCCDDLPSDTCHQRALTLPAAHPSPVSPALPPLGPFSHP